MAFKLSKRKPDDNLQLLHTILFGKKAKVNLCFGVVIWRAFALHINVHMKVIL